MSGIGDALAGGFGFDKVSNAVGGLLKGPPDPNPGLEAQANAAAQTGAAMAKLGEDQLAYAKERNAGLDALSERVTNQQMDIANQNQQQAQDYYNYNVGTFRPLEKGIVDQATQAGSTAEQDRMAGVAGADVEQNAGLARATTMRDMSRYGVNAGSPEFAATLAQGDLATGLAKAGAETNARVKARDMGFAKEMDTASLGRNLPSNATAAYGTSINAGNSAVGNTTSLNNAENANNNAALGWYGGSVGANATAGNIYNQEFNSQMQGYSANMQALGGMAQGAGMIMAMSDENAKEDKAPVNDELILEGLKRIPVSGWKYKDGVADSGRHVGPMAQDVNAQFGDGAAPGGTMIDMVTMNGITMAGLKALAKKVDRLESGAGLSRIQPGRGRDTEPRRMAT